MRKIYLFMMIGLLMITLVSATIYYYSSSDIVVNDNSNITLNYPAYATLDSINVTHTESYLEFDGINDQVEGGEIIPPSEDLINLSFSVWLKHDDFLTDSYPLAYTMGSNYAWLLKIENDFNGYQFGISSTGGWQSYNANSLGSHENGVWHNVIGVYNLTDVSIFVDGVYQGGETHENVTFYNATNLKIGSQRGVEYYEGFVDEVRVYNRTLTSSEITEIYNSGRYHNSSLPSDGLILWYDFDENQGDTVYDNSGYDNSGYGNDGV